MTDFNLILENESRRSSMEQVRKIYLYPEGTFMRAYEWSAYIWCKYVKEFKAIRRKTKTAGESVIQIGCPITAFANHLPEGAEQVQNEDGSVVVTLSPSLIPDDTDIPALAAQIDEWKQTIPVTDTAKKKADADGGTRDAFAAQPATLTSIMQQILAFPIEKKSIMDCLSFLSDIKAQLARLV